MAVRTRTSPAPYDLMLLGDGYMLARDKNGVPMYSQKKMPFSRNVVTPAAIPYLTGDPKLEVPRGFFRFDYGMGFQEEPLRADQDTPGYRYGLYIDSGEGYIVNGPNVNSTTPSTTSPGFRFFELLVGATRKLVCVGTRYVLVRDADTPSGWVVSRDFGGNVITGAATFRGTQSRTYLFVAVGTSTAYWVWDGTDNTSTWTQDAGDTALTFVSFREELWKSNGYQIFRTSDGGTAATWGAAFTIADPSVTITEMSEFDNRLIVGTDQGLYGPTAAENDTEELTPAYRYNRDASNCVGMKPWYQYLIVPMASSLHRMDQEGNFPDIGLGTLDGNTSEVQGNPTAVCGYKNFTLFASFYNAVADASYLMRWGDWAWVDGDAGPVRVFRPGWHGALYKFAGVVIKDLFCTSVTGGPRLYAVDDDGKIHYIVLPRYSMSWRSDSNCAYNTVNPGQVYFGTIHHGVPHEVKANLAVAALVENLSGADRFIDIDYRTTPTDSFDGSGNIEDSGRFNLDPGQRKDFTASVVSRMIDLRATLTCTASVPCVLKAVAVYQNVRPSFKWIINAAIEVGDDVKNRNNHPLIRIFGEDDQVDSLHVAGQAAGPVPFINPRGDSYDVIVTDIGMVMREWPEGLPQRWVFNLELIQHRSQVTVGTVGNLIVYTVGGLVPFSVESLSLL